jgi:hypothetical protein
MLIRRADLKRLWEEDRIAIHFPGDTSSNERDSESLVPADYEKPDEKGSIRAFAELLISARLSKPRSPAAEYSRG